MTESLPILRFAARLLRRDLASGRLLVMLLAAVIAVASTVSVNLLVSRVKQVVVSESSALLAGDLALATNAPAPARYASRAQSLGLKVSHTVSLRSVVASDGRLQLVRLKAVDDHYPLRGELQVADSAIAAIERVRRGPATGEVWADARLFQLLDLKVGDVLEIGSARFVLRRLLVLEPDRGGDMFALAPRLMMHLDDLERTALIVPGSRASYTLLMAGTPAALARFRDGARLEAGHSLMEPRSARPEMDSAFTQAERFLTLASFVGVLLATIGIALAAAAYSEQHERTVAILKTLGLEARAVARLLGLEIVFLAVLASVLGNTLAVLVHEVLIRLYLPGTAPAMTELPLTPFVHGAWIALIVLGGFALPALLRLARLPVTAILTRDRTTLGSGAVVPVAIMILATVLIAPWHLGNTRLVAITFVGMFAAALAIAAAALLLVMLLGRARARTSFGWRFGLANIARRARLSVVQSTAIGVGIAVLLLLGVVRNDLLEQWRGRLPDKAPNQFLINVHGDEVPALKTFLARHVEHQVRLYPMVRGRLTAIDAREVDVESYSEPRARRLVDREFNLSWAEHMKSDNRLLSGRWWQAGAEAEMSVEQGIADTLGIELGDQLSFSVADRTITAVVTSLREVQWDNFEVNFFVVTTPELLRGAPATYITSFYLDPAERALMAELVRRFPSVTVIDVDALMQQVRGVMDRVAGALGWVFAFALTAGIVVLAAAVQASQRERSLDIVLLKTLGAPRRFISTTVIIEFAVLGALAGALGSAGALGTGALIANYVLQIPYRPDVMVALAGIAGGVVGIAALGGGVVYQSHRRAVVAGLREAG